MGDKQRSLFKNLIFVFGITFLAKITGLAREIIYGSQMGVSNISDNFVMAQTIPVTLYAIVTQAFRTTYIPNLFKIRKKENERAGNAYTGNYLILVALTSGLVFILLYVFAKPLTILFAGGFSEEDILQTVQMTRIISVTVLFGGLIDVLNGYLQSNGCYNVGASLTIFSNGVFCVCLMMYSVIGVKALLLGSVFSKFTELLIVSGAVIFRKLKIDFNNWKYFSYTISALKESIPVLLGSVITDIGNLIDKRFATQLAGGTVSALDYANKIQIMVVQLFSATIGAVLFPELSRVSSDRENFKKLVERGIRYILLIMMPIAVGTICISDNFVAVLFQRGAFDLEAVNFTSQCLIFYAPAMVFTVCYEFLSKACFALHDTKTPIIMSAIGMIVNVTFNALLMRRFQHRGLAFATSLSMAIAFLGVYTVLNKKYNFDKKAILKTIGQIAIACIVMVVFIKITENFLVMNRYIAFIMKVCIGAAAYFAVLLIERCEDILSLIKMISKKVRK